MLVTRPVRAGPAAATPCGATGGVAGRAAHPSPRCHRKRLQLKSLGRGWCPLDARSPDDLDRADFERGAVLTVRLI